MGAKKQPKTKKANPSQPKATRQSGSGKKLKGKK